MNTACPILNLGVISGLVCAFVLMPANTSWAQSKEAVQVPYRGKLYFGKPLAWDGRELMLLRRDGRMSMFPITSQRQLKASPQSFEPYSFTTLQQRLRKEFGRKYQVTRTSRFLVVHPTGDSHRWGQGFQQLYDQFELYFSRRGFQLAKPEFPMVAVVLGSRSEFDRFLRDYHKYDARMLGYYSMTSNRIITYDQRTSVSHGESLLANNRTIIHEATHQTAFNRGLHHRFAPQIRWLTEGLAMMFEAPGVYDCYRHPQQIDRINLPRLRQLQQFYAQSKVKGVMQDLMVSDQLFRSDPDLAYAVAWGMTFFFAETMPRQYQAYLKADGRRADFAEYSGRDRAADFAAAFGSNLSHLEGRMKRFYQELKLPANLTQVRRNP